MTAPPQLDVEPEGLMNYLHQGYPITDIIQAVGPPGLYQFPNGTLEWNYTRPRVRVAARIIIDTSQRDYVFDWIRIQNPPTKARISPEGLALENDEARIVLGNPALLFLGAHCIQWCSVSAPPQSVTFGPEDILDLLSKEYGNEQLPRQDGSNSFNWRMAPLVRAVKAWYSPM